MTTVDLSVELLKQIRDGVHETNARIRETNSRLDATNARLDETNARLDRTRTDFLQRLDETNGRLDETNGRLDETNGRLGRLEGQVAEGLRYMRVLAERDDALATDVADLRRRVEALEASSSSGTL